ncbi:MAG: rhodanese-like domain-containing protein [Ignavibacterium sp.]|nr:rhodanese-like domain-containing protein [Ignavibacterium sp.]MCX7612016.1 rhodanese-like domain-containing protein [Ignavibacterium sp.]MDW8375376.1 rhodanese-like domain-containing protein [Ignavibacteriales bacterium]
MTTEQIFFYAILTLIIVYIIRKVYLFRTIKQYSPIELANKLKKDNSIILLDVRTPLERKQEYIKGSFHIPLYEIDKENKELLKFKDKEIVCYCRTGNRSLKAASKLRKLGFNSANLSGGIIRWNLAKVKR